VVVIPPRLHPHRAAVAAVAATANDTDADAAVGLPSLRRAWRSVASHHGRRNDGDDDDDDDDDDDRVPVAATTTTAAIITSAVHDDGDFVRFCRRVTSRVTSHLAARTLARGDVYTRATLFLHARLTLTVRAERQRNVGGRGADRGRSGFAKGGRRGWKGEIGKRHGRETRVVGVEVVGG